MSPKTRGTATMAITLFVLIACSGGGDEYNEYGQLVEKTDVRVVGVDLGRAVDSQGHVIGETNSFAPSDSIYASVRTKGSSPKTVLGVRWKNSMGDEINGNNLLIRPTGDTSTLFTLHYPSLQPGNYTLETRVNGNVVKTASFTVSTTAEPYAASPAEVAQESETQRDTAEASPDTVRPFFRKTFARLTAAATSFFDRTPRNQSPFEWKGLRAGMRFSKLDRLSQPATAWKCTPFFLSSVELERNMADNDDFSAGHVDALVDTVGQRVLQVRYGVAWIPHDTARKLVDLERDMIAVAAKWDKMPGVIHHPLDPHESTTLATWDTPDSLWRATIYYSLDSHKSDRPEGLQIEELHWDQRVMASIPDSVKAQMHNPASDFYRKPANACDAVLKSP